MASKKIQLYTDRDKTIEASPETSANCVILSDGNDLQKVLDNDLTNPTVVHEETSFKVGVGDIDVSSSVVDGEVGRMVIKGKTYQNILPEPSTHVLTNNKEMFKVNEGLDPNVEIVDAVSKSAILSGQTVDNIVDFGEGFTITNSAKDFNFLFPPKLNKEYRLIVELSNITPALGTQDYIAIRGVRADGSHEELARLTQSYNNGSYEIPCVFTKDYAKFRIAIRFTATVQAKLKGELISCKVPVLKTIGKNLWSGENITVGKYVDGQGALTATNTDFLSDFIKVKPNTTYAFKVMDSRATTPYGVKSLYDKNKKFIGRGNGVHSNNVPFTTPSNCHYVRIHGNSYTQCENTIPDCMLIETTSNPSTIATHEPYKTNILRTPEEVVLKGINGVKDTLNCNTGEYVQRIKEVVLNGSENWIKQSNGTLWRFVCEDVLNHSDYNEICDKLPTGKSYWAIDETGLYIGGNHKPVIVFNSGDDRYNYSLTQFKEWLSQNPVTVQYKLEVPTIKTVDLSSSGNWEKVVLDGSEDESWFSNFTDLGDGYYRFQGNLSMLKKPYKNENNYGMGFSDSFKWSTSWTGKSEGFYFDSMIVIRILGSKLPSLSIEGCMQYLQQNPLTIYYLTATHQDSTQVKQPIFFKDGHIQLSSGADNSLIPTLDYQAKTSNSYVMDLMKANTRYTMKAKTASGTFTINGTSYGAGTNGTFTTPSSMTNKLLVMSNKTNEEVMILEGDVVSKTIPYFKGIKSAFEDESKIEVLSTGKNLFDMNRRYDNITNAQATVVQNVDEITISSIESGTYVNVNFVLDKNFFKGKTVVGSCLYESDEKGIGTVQINYQDTTGKKYYQSIKTSKTFTFPDEFVGEVLLCVYANNTNTPQSNTVTVKNIQLELGTKSTTYDSHKSNVSKIPLLSPLRSLPNGVCDELIVDRMKKKATLIQRIKSTVFNGSEGWNLNGYSHDKLVEFVCHSGVQMAHTVFSDRFITGGENVERVAFSGGSIYIRILKTKVSNVDSFKKWLSQNPLTVQYGLQTPLITEIDLESFPLVYKDGHIFLNSEIAPVVEIDYNVNQSQQIQSNNETLQRHELDILDLDNLIVSFVNAEYNLRLLKFDMELSMMALAE